MFGFQIAVEFRRPEWMDGRHRDGTVAFLRTRDIPYVAVDMPQGHKTSMPPVFEVTSTKLAIVRFHGRGAANWDLKAAPPNQRCRYDYKDEKLVEWVPRMRERELWAEQGHPVRNDN